MAGYHFDARYDERVQLDDGTVVHFRLVGPADKRLLSDGFSHLSPETRYRRFFAAKQVLSADELRYFTEFDGVNHLAIGAIRTKPDGTSQGLGVARFVRLEGDPTAAEAAVVVVDEFQNRGLGRLLLLRLVAAARERGIVRFRATTLADNPAARALMKDLGVEPRASDEDDTLSVDMTLPEALPDTRDPPRGSTLYRLFSAVARGIADIVQTHG